MYLTKFPRVTTAPVSIKCIIIVVYIIIFVVVIIRQREKTCSLNNKIILHVASTVALAPQLLCGQEWNRSHMCTTFLS